MLESKGNLRRAACVRSKVEQKEPDRAIDAYVVFNTRAGGIFDFDGGG